MRKTSNRHHPSLYWHTLLPAIIISVATLLNSCTSAAPRTTPAPTRILPTLFPTQALPPPPPPTTARDTGWITSTTGITMRRMQIHTGTYDTPLTIARFAPATARLRVAYDPNHPRSLRAWSTQEQPLLAINGGFFTKDYHSTALVISDGTTSGNSYEGFGGMLAVAPDGHVTIHALRDHPYDPEEPLEQALQSFPMLIFPGGIPAPRNQDNQRARRSAIALDYAGNVLLIVSPTSTLTLNEFADGLAHSDLDIERALNLDGGSSTGLYLADDTHLASIDSLGPLPMVIFVLPR